MLVENKIEATEQTTWERIRRHPVFAEFSEQEIKTVIPYFGIIDLEANEYLVREGGEASNDLYLLLSGSLEVFRNAETRLTSESFYWPLKKEFVVASLSAGHSMGELGFLKGGARSASVHSKSRSQLLRLSPGQFAKIEIEFPKLSSLMMKNLLGTTAQMLKDTTDNKVRALKMELHHSIIQSKANLFFSYVIGLLCVYNLAVQQMTNLALDSGRASVLSAAIIFAFSLVLGLMIRQSELPLHFFGLTTQNWKFALWESVLWSSAVIAICVGIKAALVWYVPRFNHLPVFSFDIEHKRHLAFGFVLYGLHSPVQEFIARGVLQGSLENFFKGSGVTIRAIIISNAVFSATHVHMLGGLLAILVFIPGLFCGWLYARHGTLIGVCVSHILIGWTVLFFLDLESLF